MKTPKQILLNRHQAITPKLDLIRRQALPEPPRAESFPLRVWLELIWPSRRIWAGMAGVWAVTVILSFATPEESMILADIPPNSQITVANLQEQKLMLTQLLRGDDGVVLDVEEPVRNRTRSDRRSEQMIG